MHSSFSTVDPKLEWYFPLAVSWITYDAAFESIQRGLHNRRDDRRGERKRGVYLASMWFSMETTYLYLFLVALSPMEHPSTSYSRSWADAGEWSAP